MDSRPRSRTYPGLMAGRDGRAVAVATTLVMALVMTLGACGDDTPVASEFTLAPTTSGSESGASVTTADAPETTLGETPCPEVIDATLTRVEGNQFTASATVRSTDIEGVSYADAWEVRTFDGTALGTRILTHPHPNEQPFTRSLSDIEIPSGVSTVLFVARDSARGFCGGSFELEVPTP